MRGMGLYVNWLTINTFLYINKNVYSQHMCFTSVLYLVFDMISDIQNKLIDN